MKKVLGLTLALLCVVLPLLSLAQDDYDYNYNINWDYDYSSTADAGSSAAGAALGIGMIVFFGLVMLFCLALFIFWLVMLIDCIKRQFDQKNTWLILLIVGAFTGLYWIIAVVYYFAVKRKNLGTKPGAPVQK